jgi:hypothetical protein
MNNLEAGNYEAVTKAATVYEKEGKLLLAVAFDVEGIELRNYSVLIQADGTVNTRTVDRLKEWSGWDGADPYWFVDEAPAGIPVEVTIALEPGFRDPGRLFPKIQWVNRRGSGSGALPQAADRQKVMSRYGAKFRALAGPQPVRTATPAQGRPPAPPAPQRGKASRHATLEECWRLMGERFASLSQDEMTEKWYGLIDATGMDQADMTPEGWDQVRAAILGGAQEEDDGLPF